MVSSVGYGTATTPSTQLASVSGEASAQAAQSAVNNAIGAAQKQNEAKQNAVTKPAQPGVTVSISPEGAAAASRVQTTDQATASTDAGTDTQTEADTGTPDSAVTDNDSDIDDPTATDDATGSTEANPANVSPVKAFAYGALGLERPDQPHDERNSFYTAGKWLAAGLTIGGLISLLA
ncbi:hypothetical protein K788_0005155 [Paraburkholderia caribensis MBA4]|uniref:Uncharacterized protein n=1 Tax=Paraburkholderia caribensis MBA4 TaxID=1323664 RepID=A0A0P0RFF1_9BURK|nr:hypothetical protein [Paraburkholderia caribensis]ALL67303.1 hypothetical protein K788_0005155 [Paraburkholderia caribensis MBA4]